MRRIIILMALGLSVSGQATAQSCSPSSGSYPSFNAISGVPAGILSPASPPACFTGLAATASNGQLGQLLVNPGNGAIRLVNPRPAGNFTISVKAYSGTASASGTVPLTVGNPACGATVWSQGTPVMVGNLPRMLQLSDFNNDGKMDFITPNSGNDAIFVGLGDGNGGFATPSSVSPGSGTQPFSVACGDFNGDGNMDFASVNTAGNSLSVYLGNGAGGFTLVQNDYIPQGYYFEDVKAADLNQDGFLDLAIACRGSNNVVLATGDGNGQFSVSGTVSVGNTPYNIAIADVTGDGANDLLVVNSNDNTVSVCVNNGSGTFTTASPVTTGNYPYRIVAADFNNDGKADFATSDMISGTLTIAYGNGNGSFSTNSVFNDYYSASAMTIADMNADGFTDIISSYFGEIRVHWNNAGTFSAPNKYIITTTYNGTGLDVGDLNSDGKFDIMVARFNNASDVNPFLSVSSEIGVSATAAITDGQSTISTLDGTDFGNVLISNTQSRIFTIANTGLANLNIQSINIGGANADQFNWSGLSLPAIILPGQNATFLVSFAPTASGSKSATLSISSNDCDESLFDFGIGGNALCTPAAGSYASTSLATGTVSSVILPSVAPSCFTGLKAVASSGFLGSLVADPANGNIRIINPHPAGIYTIKVTAFDNTSAASTSFQLTVTDPLCSEANMVLTNTMTNGNLTRSMTIGDMNGDGIQDILTPNSGSNAVAIFYGTGSGNFQAPVNIPVSAQPFCIAVGDFNGDGKQDFITSSVDNITMTVFLNNGDGSFLFAQNIYSNLTSTYEDVKVADLNNDGHLDFAATAIGSNNVMIALGNGNGQFTVVSPVAVGNLPYSLVINDFNNDGKPDLAVANSSNANSVSICLGNGDGSFAASVFIPVGQYPYRMVSADFNKDGNMDFATGNLFSGDLSIGYGNGAGTFTVSTLFNDFRNISSMAVADLNGDGYPEIINASFGAIIHFGSASGYSTTNKQSLSFSQNALGLAAGQFDADGRTDLAFGGFNFPGNLMIYSNSFADISVENNTVNIPDGSSTLSSGNGTDLGSVAAGSTAQQTFTIRNNGNANLAISNAFFSGTSASLFSITGLSLPQVITAGSSINITVSLNASAGGAQSATLNLVSNDCDAGNFDFTLGATVTCSFDPLTVTASPAAICLGGNSTLGSNGNNITWTPGNLAGSSVNVSPSATTTYTANGFDQFGCPQSGSVTVTVNQVPAAPVVTGLTNICPFIGLGIPVSFHATAPGATNFTWTLPPNTSLVSGAGTGDIDVMFLPGFATQANKQIRVTATSTCGTSPQTIYYLLAQFPSTPGSISGPTDVCPLLGSSAVYSVPQVPGAASYIWTAQPGVTVTPNGFGPFGFSVTVSFPAGFTSSALTVQAVNDCGSSGTRSLMIYRNNPVTPSPISGPTNVCAFIAPGGSPANYSVTAMPGMTYNWSLPAGAANVTGQGTNAISFVYPQGFSSGTVSVTATNGCGTSPARSLNVSRLNPATPGVIDVINTQGCPDRRYTYTIASMPANTTNLQWTATGGTILSGQGSTSITVSYPDMAVTGSVSVQSLNACGASSIRSVSVKLPACPFGKPAEPVYAKTGNNNSPVQTGFIVYPNPSAHGFNMLLDSKDPGLLQLRILDMQGRVLERMSGLPNRVSRVGERLKAGTYILEIIQGESRFTQKLIKL